MIFKDIIDISSDYSNFRIFSFDLSGRPITSRIFRKDKIPPFLYYEKVKKIVCVNNLFEISLDTIGDIFGDSYV